LNVISILSPDAVILQNISSKKSKKIYSIIIMIKSVNISSEIPNFGRDIDFIAWCGDIIEYEL
jgi:hypothetical protein